MASTLQPPGFPVGRPKDKGFWEEYLKEVIDEDIQLITRWQKILDTLLVYVCFCLPPSDNLFRSFEIGRTLHRSLDGIHHSGVNYVSTKFGRCNEQHSHFCLQPHYECLHTYRPSTIHHME